jgi:hypothetical protein
MADFPRDRSRKCMHATEHLGIEMRGVAAAVALLLGLAFIRPLGVCRRFADSEPEAFARVVVDSAELRTGPGVSYRSSTRRIAARRSPSTAGRARASG